LVVSNNAYTTRYLVIKIMLKKPKIRKLITPVLLGLGLTFVGELPASSFPNHGNGRVHHQRSQNHHRDEFRNRGNVHHQRSHDYHRDAVRNRGNVHHQRSDNYHREVFRNRGDRRSLNVRPRRQLEPVRHDRHGNVHHQRSGRHGDFHDEYYYDRYGNRRRRRFNRRNNRNIHNRRSNPNIKIRVLI